MGIWIGSRTRPRGTFGPCGTQYLAGQAASFNGSNYLQVATAAGLSSNQPLIVAGWVYMGTATTGMVIASKVTTSAETTKEWKIIYFSGFGFYCQVKVTGGTQAFWTGGTPTAGNWYHVALEVVSNIGTAYLNGTGGAPNSGCSGTFTDGNACPVTLGAMGDGSSPITNGSRLDAWGMWAGATLPTVASLYNGGAGLPYSGLSGAQLTKLKAYWNLDEVNGSATWCDWSGNAFNLTNTGSVVTAVGKV